MENYIGNITTIIKAISMILAGWAIGTATAHNLDMGVDAATLSQVITSLAFLFLAYLDAKYPNTFRLLGNNKPSLGYPIEETVLNDDYISEIEDDEDGC